MSENELLRLAREIIEYPQKQVSKWIEEARKKGEMNG